MSHAYIGTMRTGTKGRFAIYIHGRSLGLVGLSKIFIRLFSNDNEEAAP